MKALQIVRDISPRNLCDLVIRIKYLAQHQGVVALKGQECEIEINSRDTKGVLERHFKEITGDFIRNAFKSRKIGHQDLHRIVARWLRDESESN